MSDPVIHPKFHHFNLKTTRLQELIDWYSTVVGAEVIHQDAVGAWLSNVRLWATGAPSRRGPPWS